MGQEETLTTGHLCGLAVDAEKADCGYPNGSGALAINYCVRSMLDHDDCVCRFSEIGILAAGERTTISLLDYRCLCGFGPESIANTNAARTRVITPTSAYADGYDLPASNCRTAPISAMPIANPT